MLAAVCHACVVSDGSTVMLRTVEEEVYGISREYAVNSDNLQFRASLQSTFNSVLSFLPLLKLYQSD